MLGSLLNAAASARKDRGTCVVSVISGKAPAIRSVMRCQEYWSLGIKALGPGRALG